MNRPLHTNVYPGSLRSFAMLALALVLSLFAPLSSRAAILNSQEQQIANDMVSDSHQGRPFMVLDPILASVARARAADMANRDYFAHVNPDGKAANYLVEKAGYALPDWWGNDPKQNYVESIAAGYSSPGAAWDGWMASSDHKTHILGQNSFYASETHYGVGYVFDAGSRYQHYWVIITAPPAPAPKLSITAPDNNTQVTTSTVAIAGKTAAGSGAASVVYRIENSSGNGPFRNATGVATWSAVATELLPGENTIHVRSLNNSGATIADASRNVTYVVLGTLNVLVSGSGSVTGGFAGTTQRPVGKDFTIKAEPAPGYLFAGWSGDASSAGATLGFTMEDGMTVQANFVKNSFLALKGSYQGSLDSTTAPGFFQVTMTKNGEFTGRVLMNGESYRFRGRFDLNGAAAVTLPEGAGTLALQINLGHGVGEITGTISGGNFTTQLSANRVVFSRHNHAPQAGRYTLVLAPNAAAAGGSVPPGCGYATLTVSANGSVAIAGRLADNSPFTHGSVVTETGDVPFFAKSTGDFISGTVAFRATDVSDLDGSVTWNKAADQKDALYPAGFTTQLPVVGSRFQAVAPRTRALNFTNGGRGTAALIDGNFNTPVAIPVTLTESNKVQMVTPGTPDLSLRINSANGIVSGTFTHLDGKSRTVRGVVLQKQNGAFGFFRGVDEGGDFSLAAN